MEKVVDTVKRLIPADVSANLIQVIQIFHLLQRLHDRREKTHLTFLEGFITSIQDFQMNTQYLLVSVKIILLRQSFFPQEYDTKTLSCTMLWSFLAEAIFMFHDDRFLFFYNLWQEVFNCKRS